MSKLSYEWTGEGKVTIRKARGKITMEELVQFFHEDKQIRAFEGMLLVYMFRVNGDADIYPYGYEDDPGDVQDMIVVDDDSHCPICGQKIFLQYCPECGHKLFGSEAAHAD